MIDTSNPEIQFAVNIVRESALLADLVQKEMVTGALTKEDRSPVTVADYAVQALVANRLKTAIPDAILVAEEDADALRETKERPTLEQIQHFVGQKIEGASANEICDWIDLGANDTVKRFWTLDPVDGTKGFLRKEQYAVALALIEDGEVQIAAIGCPNIRQAHKVDLGGEGSLIIAVRDKGTWTQSLRKKGEWQALQVSPQIDRTRARLLRSAEAAHTDLSALDEIVQHLGIGGEPVRMDSQAKYGVRTSISTDIPQIP
jgi:3'(2'), 5'-bisphosphate nucleotidase